jgi:hypothetical protein
MSVDGKRGIGFVRLQHGLDRLTRGGERGIIKRAVRKCRREPGRDQQHIAFAQWHVEALGQPQHHIARGYSAAGLDETQMTRGNLGFGSKIELAEMAALPPFAQMIANMSRLCGSWCCKLCRHHDENLACDFHAFHYLRGNRFQSRHRSS